MDGPWWALHFRRYLSAWPTCTWSNFGAREWWKTDRLTSCVTSSSSTISHKSLSAAFYFTNRPLLAGWRVTTIGPVSRSITRTTRRPCAPLSAVGGTGSPNSPNSSIRYNTFNLLNLILRFARLPSFFGTVHKISGDLVCKGPKSQVDQTFMFYW